MSKFGHVLINEDGKIASVDGKFCDFMRGSPEILIGRSVRDVTAPADRAECDAAIGRLLKTGSSFEITKRFLRDDASVFWSKNSVSLSTDARGATTIVATIDPVRSMDGRHPATLLSVARKLIAARRERASVCDPELFSEPAWDTILAAYVAEAEGCSIDAATLSGSLDVAQPTTQRWVSVLIQHGVLEIEYRRPTAETAKAFRLTAATQQKLEDYLVRSFALLVGPDVE